MKKKTPIKKTTKPKPLIEIGNLHTFQSALNHLKWLESTINGGRFATMEEMISQIVHAAFAGMLIGLYGHPQTLKENIWGKDHLETGKAMESFKKLLNALCDMEKGKPTMKTNNNKGSIK